MKPILSDSRKTTSQRLTKGWIYFFGVCVFESFAALIWLAIIPGDPKNNLFLGYSSSRLALMAGILGCAAAFSLALILCIQSRKFQRSLSALSGNESRWFWPIISLLAITLAAAWGFLVEVRADPGEATYSIFERLKPVLFLIGLVSLEGIGWLVISKFGFHWSRLAPFRRPLIIWSVIFTGIVILAAVLAVTGLGIIPDEFFWGSPGVPLLSWQVAASGLIALAAFGIQKAFRRPMGWQTDLTLFVFFWVGAYLIWMSQPVPRSFFSPGPRAPNFEVYPYSDAGVYDYVSQSILTGNGFLNHKIITRPIYSVILAGIHALAGQDYNQVIALQTVLLALFPALLYLLGKTLHSRPVGILTAALAVWREMNLIAATPFTEVSNSKMLMTDSLTGVAFAAWILGLVWWQKRKPGSLIFALGIGGFFGLMLLLRFQALIVLPVVALVLLVNYRRRLRRGLATVGLLVLGTILSFSPWVIRNYAYTGLIAFDQPSQAALQFTRFALSLDTVD